MDEKSSPLCWGEIAMLREVGQQNELPTDRLHDSIGLLSKIVHKQAEILKDLQAMKLMPYIEMRLRVIKTQQQRRAA